MKDFVFNLQLFAKIKTVRLTQNADDYTTDKSNVKIIGLCGNDTIDTLGKNVTICGGNGDDSIKTRGGKYIKIYGEMNDDYIITVGTSIVTVYGGDGNDTIIKDYTFGGEKNIKLYGGEGNDYFYASGNSSEKTQNITINGGNGDDIIKIRDNMKNIKIYGGQGKDTIEVLPGHLYATKVNGGSGTDYISIYSDNVKVYGDGGDDEIHATDGASNVTMYGGAGNDTIIGSYGVSGKTTSDFISGGKGNDYLDGGYYDNSNDTLTGGNGRDIFAYGSTYYGGGNCGDDVITDYTPGVDKIKLKQYSTVNNVTVSGRDVILTIGDGRLTDGTLTVKNAKGKKITFLDEFGNETIKKYSKSANVAELFAENNFMTSDNLSEIVKNDLTATDYKIDTQNFENLTQKNNLITFAEK